MVVHIILLIRIDRAQKVQAKEGEVMIQDMIRRELLQQVITDMEKLKGLILLLQVLKEG